jgi:hypothetical protein
MQMFYPKAGYYGVRNAITNYFGRAFIVKSSSGGELARFVENGNMLLMKMPPGTTDSFDRVHEGFSAWTSLNLSAGNNFIVKGTSGSYKAVITSDGDLYLAGHVYENQSLSLSGNPAFYIVAQNNEVVAKINGDGDDDSDGHRDGDLNMKGYLLVGGLPYQWRNMDTVDLYFDN